jgi:predicted nuclease of predicted toxin-antitoxin system
MPSFLLDEHISPKIATQLQNKHPEIVVYTLQAWQYGRYLGAPDSVIIDAASQHSLTLVTSDLRTIPGLLKTLSTQQKNHAGVVFVCDKTIKTKDIGGLVKELSSLWKKEHKNEWTNRIIFLKKPGN